MSGSKLPPCDEHTRSIDPDGIPLSYCDVCFHDMPLSRTDKIAAAIDPDQLEQYLPQ